MAWGDVPLAPMGMAPLGTQQYPPADGSNTAPNNMVVPAKPNGRPQVNPIEPGPKEPVDAVSPKEIDEFVSKVVSMVKGKMNV